MFLLSHSGKQHSYHVAKELNALGQLERFYTSSYITNSKFQSYFLQKGNKYWTRRFIEGLPGNKVNANWRFEIPELLMRQLHSPHSKVIQTVYKRDERFDAYVAKQIKKSHATHFWGFQGSSYQSLKAAKANNLQAWYELAAVYPSYSKVILQEEKEINPVWADSIDSVVYPEAYYQRILEEPFLADKVIVANAFSKRIMMDEGIPEERLIHLPLGVDVSRIPFNPVSPSNQPLKLLFAGRMTQGKGISYFLDALQGFDQQTVQATIIGSVQGSGNGLKPYLNRIELQPPVHQHDLFKKYGEYHALVLPTLTEGFGLVIIEAMAAGLPVITTPHSIGPELIEDDVNGYIVPIRNVDALANAIEKLRNKNDDDYLQMRLKAREAALKYSWEAYRERLKGVLEEAL